MIKRGKGDMIMYPLAGDSGGGGLNNAPALKNGHVLRPITCECYFQCGKGVCKCDLIKIGIWEIILDDQ